MQGIGETFQPNLFSGTGNFTVPIAATPGRAGFGPQLTLQYSTGNGNGSFGLGWKLSIPRISRKTEKGLPRFTDEDVFVLSGSEDLVVSNNQPPEDSYAGYFIVRYRPRTEGLFARIDKWTKTNGEEVGDVHWRILTKDNVTNIYGKSKSARITDPNHADHVYEWLLEETFDNKGNHLLYEYVQEDPILKIQTIFDQNKQYTQAYIRRILYGNTPHTLDPLKQLGPKRSATHHHEPTQSLERHYLFELLFDYGDLPDLPELPFVHPSSEESIIPANWPMREDPFSTFRPGFEVRTLRRCKRVWMLHHFEELDGAPLVKSTNFEYVVNPETRISFLKTVQVVGHKKQDENYLSSSMPPVTFTYSTFEPEKQRYQSVTAKGNDLPPRSLNDSTFSLTDLFGDALPDVVETRNDGYYFWRNLGQANLDRRHPQHGAVPSVSTAQSNVAIGDMGGDGRIDLVVDAPPLAGFFESTPDGRWKPFKKFESFPSLDLSDPNVRLTDLTGDGLTDILITRDQHFLWFQCLGEAGYGAPQHTARLHDLNEFPDLYFNDPSGRVRLADMIGDGLNDMVLVHNGRIDYWPNLGYGRFGKRVTMAQSPRLPHDVDPRRLFLVDLDGTGCADLVYVDHCQVHFWFNQSGNGWSEQQTIQGTPYVSDLTAIQFADFFGTGTACLLWSYDSIQQHSGNYKVLDFCGGNKPHLLVEMNNNMGATTRVQYAASTKFYLEDQAAGTPWATNLPFPVQVVEKSEMIDHIGKTKLATTYKYHHGYYDGREREFRGFGRVDQYDTEEFAGFSEASLHGKAIEFENKHQAYHVPPVLTKTWFHTGVYFDEDNVSPSGIFYDHHDLMKAYSKEFYQGDEQAFLLNGHEVEHSGTPHEAYRALRGALIREEVYALDDSQKAGHPYTVAENLYRVKELQAKEENRYAVYLSTQSENVNYQYERNPNDPRIGQNLVLAVDEYGQVTDSISIAYPRRLAPPDLPDQAKLLVVYTKSDYINKVDSSSYYYLGVPCQTRTYEVTGLSWTQTRIPMKPEVFNEILDSGLIMGKFQSYGWKRPEGHVGLEKRIIKWQRSYFRTDATSAELDISLNAENQPMRMLTNRLALGEIESLALPYESYAAATNDDLLVQIFTGQANVSPEMLRGGGYHQEPDTNGYWWIPSGQQSFDQAKFYLSEVTRDPFATDKHNTYDDYAVMTVEATDTLGNHTQSNINYRVLQPEQITDPNGNRTAVTFNALGFVSGSAVMGKEGEALGDKITDNFKADLTYGEIDAFYSDPLANAAELLDTATTRIVYDLYRYQKSGHPPFSATLVRETHSSNPVPTDRLKIRISFNYSDGFGRIAQSKVQAEPDNATPNLPRWVGTGTTLINNKGKDVIQYEPFFSKTHKYGIEQHGVSSTLFYDPLERLVATLYPNHTYEKVLFDPWQQETWDVNDTVLLEPQNDPDVKGFFPHLPIEDYLPTWYALRTESVHAAKAEALWPDGKIRDAEQVAAQRAAIHAATPTIAHMDTLGRPFLTIVNNGQDKDGLEQKKYSSRVELDIEGNQLAIIDARGNQVMSHGYDLLSNPLNQVSMDAGTRWMLLDISGKPRYRWDSRGHQVRTTYDQLQRPRENWLSVNLNVEMLVEETIYGETQNSPENQNLRGQVYQVKDGAGTVTNSSYDFKGNLLISQRVLLQDYKNQVDWTQSQALEEEIFTTRITYDALNRPITIKTPEDSVFHPTYNEANLLKEVQVNLRGQQENDQPIWTTFVQKIDYDAKGQRILISYGNGTTTKYRYDDETFRLKNLQTSRDTTGDLQNFSYTYDPIGNITTIQDGAQQTIYFNNAQVAPTMHFEYDPLYRLVKAQGREHVGQITNNLPEHQPNWKPHYDFNDTTRRNLPHPNDWAAMRNYTEWYEYDGVGNILRMRHVANGGSWTRHYSYQPTNNQLRSTSLPIDFPLPEPFNPVALPDRYTYDAHGNMTAMPNLSNMESDFKDQLRHVNLGGGGTAHYVYDSAGQRIRKVVEKNNGTLIEERIYLGSYEIFRKHETIGLILQRESLHIMDEQKRIALVETRTHGTESSPTQSIRYQYGNHLGSTSLELDVTGAIISYEEYHPYGTTAFQAGRSLAEVSLKRYRYTSKERDEETGLYYHGARYYACWLGRWTASDPAGMVDGGNVYSYVGNNPVSFIDSTGTQRGLPRGGYSENEINLINQLPWNKGAPLQLNGQGELTRPQSFSLSDDIENAVQHTATGTPLREGNPVKLPRFSQPPERGVTQGLKNVAAGGATAALGLWAAVSGGSGGTLTIPSGIVILGGVLSFGTGSAQAAVGVGQVLSDPEMEQLESDERAINFMTTVGSDPISLTMGTTALVATGDITTAERVALVSGIVGGLDSPEKYGSRLYAQIPRFRTQNAAHRQLIIGALRNDPNNPLYPLINPATGKFYSGHWALANDPVWETGHVISKLGFAEFGAPELVQVESKFFNQLSSHKIETPGGLVVNPGRLIGNIAVEERTAFQYAASPRFPLITPAMVKQAPVVFGQDPRNSFSAVFNLNWN